MTDTQFNALVELIDLLVDNAIHEYVHGCASEANRNSAIINARLILVDNDEGN